MYRLNVFVSRYKQGRARSYASGTLQTHTVPSAAPQARNAPSGENATPLTPPGGPSGVRTSVPSGMRQTCMAQLADIPAASRRPEGAKATLRTYPAASRPTSAYNNAPSETRHSRTALSPDPAANVVPSGAKARPHTSSASGGGGNVC